MHYSYILLFTRRILTKSINKNVEHSHFPEIFPDHGLVQAVGRQKKMRNVLRRVSRDEFGINQELNALRSLAGVKDVYGETYTFGFEIELLDTFQQRCFLLFGTFELAWIVHDVGSGLAKSLDTCPR